MKVLITGGGYDRAEIGRLVAACEALTCGPVEAVTPCLPRTRAEYAEHEHGGVEQRGPVRGVLPVLSQGWRLNEESRTPRVSTGPTEVHAVARRCCELAGCARGKCLACLATRQRHRPKRDVPGSSDLVQQEAAALTVRNVPRLDWEGCRWAVTEVGRIWVSSTSVSPASDR